MLFNITLQYNKSQVLDLILISPMIIVTSNRQECDYIISMNEIMNSNYMDPVQYHLHFMIHPQSDKLINCNY